MFIAFFSSIYHLKLVRIRIRSLIAFYPFAVVKICSHFTLDVEKRVVWSGNLVRHASYIFGIETPTKLSSGCVHADHNECGTDYSVCSQKLDCPWPSIKLWIAKWISSTSKEFVGDYIASWTSLLPGDFVQKAIFFATVKLTYTEHTHSAIAHFYVYIPGFKKCYSTSELYMENIEVVGDWVSVAEFF